MSVENSFVDHPFVKGFGQNHEHFSAFEVRTVQYGIDRSRKRVRMSFVLAFIIEIVDSITVGKHDSVIVPFAAKDIHQETVTGTARNTFVSVVGTHHFAYIAFLYKSLESREVGFPKVAHRNGCIVSVT